MAQSNGGGQRGDAVCPATENEQIGKHVLDAKQLSARTVHRSAVSSNAIQAFKKKSVRSYGAPQYSRILLTLSTLARVLADVSTYGTLH